MKKMPVVDRQNDDSCHDNSISPFLLVGPFKLVSASQDIFFSTELLLFSSFLAFFILLVG
jgi:hypothetical protein